MSKVVGYYTIDNAVICGNCMVKRDSVEITALSDDLPDGFTCDDCWNTVKEMR